MSELPDLDWTDEELAGFDPHDARLHTRGKRILATLEAHPTLSIPAACGSPAEIDAMYDFFGNPKVRGADILASHAQATQARLAEYSTVLLIADSTEFNYSDKTVAGELGYIGHNQTRGFFWYPLFAVAVAGDVLGVVASQEYLRTEISPTTSQQRKHQPITEKETRHILQAYRQACETQAATPATQCIFVYDRGGDLYEIYQEHDHGGQSHPADFLIRGREYERLLQSVVTVGGGHATKEAQSRSRRLDQLLQLAPALGELTFTVPPTATRPARVVTQQIQTVTVTLQPPARTGLKLQPATVRVIWCHEIAPPEGVEPLDWLFYTSLPVNTAADAEWVVKRYLQRWDIELYFKILKSGCHIEQLYLQKKSRLQTALAFYMIVAWRILQFTRMGRTAPDLPCTILFSELEWQTVVINFTGRLPAAPPPLQAVIRLVGRLGGNVGRRGDGEPGIQSLWIGLSRIRDMVQGALAHRNIRRLRQ
jgi:hypothetical protein